MTASILAQDSFATISTTDKEAWRRAGYAAIDRMIEFLGNTLTRDDDFEKVSQMLEQPSKDVTAAVFSGILSTLGKEQQQAKSCNCPECGKLLRAPRNQRRTLDTQYGRISVERPYFYCKACHRGVLPFDEKLGLAPTCKQYDLQRKAAPLLADLPFERAAELFKTLTGCEMSNHAMHDLAKGLSAASDIASVLPSRHAIEKLIEENSPGGVWRPIVVVSADGAHMPTRPASGTRQGKRGSGEWREAKGFRFYMVGQERTIQLVSWHQIANEAEFGEALQFAATLIPQDKVRIALVADGAAWIWKHFQSAFPNGKEILDYYHCSEHVHALAAKQYHDDSDRQALWVESTMARLNDGDVESVIWGLQRMTPADATAQKEIENLITYLRNNAHRIDYKKFKRGQYPRGSGGIESANKFICHVRMKRSGAWWYVINGNDMLRLRCAIHNGTFDEVFRKYKALHRKPSTNG
jgi:hypothetical protein